MRSILLVIMASSATGCSSSREQTCTTNREDSVVVVLRDPATHVPLCVEGAVVIRDGAYEETLRLGGQVTLDDGTTSCAYQGAMERAGTYAITATISGYATATGSVTASLGVCHVTAPTVVLDLTRS